MTDLRTRIAQLITYWLPTYHRQLRPQDALTMADILIRELNLSDTGSVIVGCNHPL